MADSGDGRSDEHQDANNEAADGKEPKMLSWRTDAFVATFGSRGLVQEDGPVNATEPNSLENTLCPTIDGTLEGLNMMLRKHCAEQDMILAEPRPHPEPHEQPEPQPEPQPQPQPQPQLQPAPARGSDTGGARMRKHQDDQPAAKHQVLDTSWSSTKTEVTDIIRMFEHLKETEEMAAKCDCPDKDGPFTDLLAHVCKSITEVLQPGQFQRDGMRSTIVCAGHSSHNWSPVLFLVRKHSEQLANIVVCNTGRAANCHPFNENGFPRTEYRTTVGFYVPIERAREVSLWTMVLRARVYAHRHAPEELYEVVIPWLRGFAPGSGRGTFHASTTVAVADEHRVQPDASDLTDYLEVGPWEDVADAEQGRRGTRAVVTALLHFLFAQRRIFNGNALDRVRIFLKFQWLERMHGDITTSKSEGLQMDVSDQRMILAACNQIKASATCCTNADVLSVEALDAVYTKCESVQNATEAHMKTHNQSNSLPKLKWGAAVSHENTGFAGFEMIKASIQCGKDMIHSQVASAGKPLDAHLATICDLRQLDRAADTIAFISETITSC
eukprot:COSAG02_NODE_7351_length_3052_cov_6.603793_1_plen_554_part_10